MNGNNRCSSQGSIPFTASFLGTSQVSYSTLHLLDQVQTPSSPCPAGSPLFWCSSRWINASDISRYFSDVVHQGFILCLRIETSVFNSSSTPQQGFSGLSAARSVSGEASYPLMSLPIKNISPGAISVFHKGACVQH